MWVIGLGAKTITIAITIERFLNKESIGTEKPYKDIKMSISPSPSWS